jgi:hypothetical protein
MIAMMAVVMMVGAANATVTAIALTDGDDDTFFYGEEITLTWSSTNPQSSIWINSTGASWGSAFDDNTSMYDDKNTCPLANKGVSGSGGAPFTYTYTFANYTVNESAQAWVVYINDTSGAAMPGTCANESFVMNSYNVSLQTGRSAAEGNSTLAGDTIEVSVTTSGMLAKTERDGLGITITPLEGGNTVSGASNVAGTGNYTFNITAAKAGVGALKNVTLNYGGFSWNSTQLTTYSGWGSAANTQFNVSELNLKAYDISGTTTVQYIASVNITTTLGGNKVTANIAYPINITLTRDQSNLKFNRTLGTASLQDTTMNLTVPAGLNEGNYGNYTFPVNGTLTSKVTSETSGTITATVNTSGEAWTDGFVIHPDTEYNVLTAPSAATSYQIGELVNITGWNSTGVAPRLNITDIDGVLINSTVVDLNPTDNSFEYTWDTNRTWNTMQTTTWNATLNKTGSYKLTLGNESSTIDTITISLNEDITAAPNTTSIPVNGSLWINGTTDRWNSNGTFMNCTISTASNKGGSIINNSTLLSDVINDFSAATGLATYNISWDSSVNLTEIVASAAPVSSDTFDKTYYITVNDSAAKEIAATFQITDSITVNPATGIPGRNFTVTGTSPRENGTIITVNVYSSGFPGAPATNNSTAIVFGNEWNATMDASYKGGGSLSALYTYTVVADDSIVKDSADLTLGTGSISLESLPDTTMDGIVWFNGTTDLGSGTVVWFNVTNATGFLFNRTSDTVAGTTFNLSWQVNTSLITGNFTAPVEQCNVKAYNGTIYTTKTLNVREDLVITTPDFEIATGGEFKIEGTLNRVNTTVLTVKTSRAGVLTDDSLATVYGGQFNVTLEAVNTEGTGEPLPAGEYTITVKDGTNASASITMTVAAAKVTLESPADGATYNVNDTIPVDGTSNIGNNTNISVMIQRTSGPEGWTPFTTTLYGTTDFTGHWSTEWNTSADSTFQALSTTSGNYRFWAQNGSTYSLMPVITIAAVLTVDTIVVDPAGPVSLPNVSDTQQFNATCKNGTTELTGITVTWNSDNTTVGTIDASGLFTAVANGTTNVTATAQDVTSDPVTVTVGAAELVGDINGDSKVDLDDLILLGAAWGTSTGETGYSAAADINSNGVIDIDDLILLGANWTG